MNEIDYEVLSSKLIQMQDLDTRITGLKKDIDGLADKHHLSELHTELQDTKNDLGLRETELSEIEHRQHKLDGELDLLSKKISTEEEKMFSGTIMNPKELTNIQEEILSLRKKRDEMETKDLELMEDMDRIRGAIAEATAKAQQIADRERQAKEVYDLELADEKRQVSEFETERDDLKRGIDEESLEIYDKLLKDKAGLAVVRIDQGRNCGGCHIEFSRTQIDRFQHEEGLFRCEFCGRILVR